MLLISHQKFSGWGALPIWQQLYQPGMALWSLHTTQQGWDVPPYWGLEEKKDHWESRPNFLNLFSVFFSWFPRFNPPHIHLFSILQQKVPTLVSCISSISVIYQNISNITKSTNTFVWKHFSSAAGYGTTTSDQIMIIASSQYPNHTLWTIL